MNIKEFAALRVGDHVLNGMNANARGEIVETSDSGVRLIWGPRHSRETSFFYSVNSTAWMHWSKAEPRRMTCDYCGSDDPPNHLPGCTHPGKTGEAPATQFSQASRYSS